MGGISNTPNRNKDLDYVEFTVPVRDMQIGRFPEYRSLNEAFTARLTMNVWVEFQLTVERAINSYCQDNNLSQWFRSYECLSTGFVISGVFCCIAGIYSCFAFTVGVILNPKGAYVQNAQTAKSHQIKFFLIL